MGIGDLEFLCTIATGRRQMDTRRNWGALTSYEFEE
jgi:hypothetical protein